MSTSVRKKLKSQLKHLQSQLTELDQHKPTKEELLALRRELFPRQRGRPRRIAVTFEQQMNLLYGPEQSFIRHVMSGSNYAQAYQKDHPDANPATARKGGHSMAHRNGVAFALKLGREAGALQQITGLKFDVKDAFDELGEIRELSIREGQMNAALGASIGRCKIFKHIDSKETPGQAQQVTFNFSRFQKDAESVTIETTPTAPLGPDDKENPDEPLDKL